MELPRNESEYTNQYSARMEQSAVYTKVFFNKLKQSGIDSYEELVFRRLTARNSHLYDDEKYTNKTVEFLQNTDNQDLGIELGIELGVALYSEHKTPRDKILSYANTLSTMTYMRDALEIPHRAGTSTAMMDVLGWTILETMPNKAKNDQSFEAILSAINTAEEKGPSAPEGVSLYALYRSAVERLYGLSVNAAALKNIISKNYTEADHPSYEKDTSRMTATLTREAMEQRKYGTKPAWIEASTGGAWVFYDGEDFKRKLKLDTTLPIAAVVSKTNHTDLKDLRIKAKLKTLEDGRSEYALGGVLDSETTDYLLYIMHDGSIATDRQGLNDLSLHFKDTPGIAERVKAEVASNFYDLSMPVYKNAPVSRNYSLLTDSEKVDFNPIEDLLIPRLRYIGKTSGHASPEAARAVRHHDVTWFVRTLPTGWHASPEAIEEARKRGIKLEDNETFVREHSRGSKINKALGYHAIRR